MTLSDVMLFKPQFNQSVLERYVSPAEMTAFRQRITDQCEEAARYVVRQRQVLFDQIGTLVQEGLADQKPPFILQRTTDQKTEADYRATSLTGLANWLETNRTRFAVAKLPQVNAVIASLRQVKLQENRLKQELKMQFDSLEPVLAFDWLYIDDAKWIIELAAWCFFGLLANTIIKLIGAMRADDYRPREFCLIFPKAILAPVLALVVTALWASGLSESKINFANLPYLLVLFFLLGFATENLYGKIVGLADLIVTPTATLAQAKLEAAARESRYKYTTERVEKDDLPPPQTLSELETKLKQVAKSAYERGLVTQLAKEQEKP